jgi:hypothetical protein
LEEDAVGEVGSVALLLLMTVLYGTAVRGLGFLG